jgi:hypothetical protein
VMVCGETPIRAAKSLRLILFSMSQSESCMSNP